MSYDRVMTPEHTELTIEIRPADQADLETLAEHFLPSSRAIDHARRFAVQQQGGGVYLIAWHGNEPVGHFMIRWHGPAHDLILFHSILDVMA